MPTLTAFCTLRDLAAPPTALQVKTAAANDAPDLQAAIDRLRQPARRDPAYDGIRLAILQHLQRCRHVVTLASPNGMDDALAAWAWTHNAILYDATHHFRDPDGHLLLADDATPPDAAAQLPYPADARQRKAQNDLLLRNRLIDCPETLPPVVGEDEVKLRDAAEIAERALALFLIAVRAESIAKEQPLAPELLREKAPRGWSALSPWEAAFMQQPQPHENDVGAAGWRYEALFALQWALGLQPALPFPDDLCDVPTVATQMIAQGEADFCREATRRGTAELLDALDLHQRLLWAARQAYHDGTPPPAAINGHVIAQRQHALNWLTNPDGPDWDEVDTPT